MVFSTSAVAVWRSSASFVSLKSRVFSIAMTAWSAKVWRSAMSLSEKEPEVERVTLIVPIVSPV